MAAREDGCIRPLARIWGIGFERGPRFQSPGRDPQSFSCFDELSEPRFDGEPDDEPDAPDEPAELPNVTPSFVAVC